MADYQIITVDAGNVEEFGFFCIKNKKHPGYIAKRSWLRQRFEEGMRIKLILTPDGQQAGFLEYIPGEYTWRVIDAPNYLVIHCIMVGKKFSDKDLGSALLKDCLNDAKASGKLGVAVVTSDDSFMASREIFIKNGFDQVDEAEPRFQLFAKSLKKGPQPSFPTNWEERLSQYQGLQLVYTHQCPFIGKGVEELPPVAEKHGISLYLVELKDAAEAREKMPSPYGMINLIYNGQLLADHPISATRFKNILQNVLRREMKSKA